MQRYRGEEEKRRWDGDRRYLDKGQTGLEERRFGGKGTYPVEQFPMAKQNKLEIETRNRYNR